MANRVYIKKGRIASLSLPGGSIYRFGEVLAKEAEVDARVKAPSRTGLLKAYITSDVFSNQNGVTIDVFSRASYSLYVHEGTAGGGTGFIFPKNGRALHLQPPHNGYPESIQAKVRGQAPNPFLLDALQGVVRRNRHIT